MLYSLQNRHIFVICILYLFRIHILFLFYTSLNIFSCCHFRARRERARSLSGFESKLLTALVESVRVRALSVCMVPPSCVHFQFVCTPRILRTIITAAVPGAVTAIITLTISSIIGKRLRSALKVVSRCTGTGPCAACKRCRRQCGDSALSRSGSMLRILCECAAYAPEAFAPGRPVPAAASIVGSLCSCPLPATAG